MDRPAEQIPPLLNSPRQHTAPIIFALTVLALIAAKLTAHLQIGLPICAFKAITGWPCVFCGGTRAFRALASLHIAEAFRWNPFATLSAFVIFAWFIAWAVIPQRLNQMTRRLERLRLWPYLLLLLALNWIYLFCFLPR